MSVDDAVFAAVGLGIVGSVGFAVHYLRNSVSQELKVGPAGSVSRDPHPTTLN